MTIQKECYRGKFMDKFTQHKFYLFWQHLTNQVCKCNHAKWWHSPTSDKTRSDIQCGQFIFEGGAFGEHGTLHCCQCLSYHQKPLPFRYCLHIFKQIFKKPKEIDVVEYSKSHYCVCGHSAFDHDIGNPDRVSFEPMYPPCNICSCKEYDYVNNPKIGNDNLARM